MQGDDIRRYPLRQLAGKEALGKSDLTVERTVGPFSAEPWTLVTIDLSPEQQEAIVRLTGERLLQLKILVEDLVDLGDLVAN